MERRNFLKKLFGIGLGAAALTTVPAIAKKEETYSLDDLFYRCEGNSDLYFLKPDSWLNDELKKAFGDKVVSREYFRYYNPLYNIYIPIKERYDKRDFDALIQFAKANKWEYWCGDTYKGKEVGLCKMLRYREENYFKVDLYNCRNPKSNSNY